MFKIVLVEFTPNGRDDCGRIIIQSHQRNLIDSFYTCEGQNWYYGWEFDAVPKKFATYEDAKQFAIENNIDLCIKNSCVIYISEV